MNRKRLAALLVLFAVLMSFTMNAFAAPTVGGWKTNTKASSYLTKSDKAVFNKAVKGMTGVKYTPVFKIATQVVAGRNYAFFCKGVTATKNPVTSWKVVVVYENLKGNASVKDINDFDYTEVKTTKSAYGTKSLSGGWQYNTKAYTSKVLPKEAGTVFKKATKKYTGVGLTALVLLGKQTVAGTNYRYLCRGAMTDAKGTVSLYVVDVYKNLKGKCEVTNCEIIDVPAYLG